MMGIEVQNILSYNNTYLIEFT